VVNDGGDPALSRNRAVSVSEGLFVSFLDADDLWSENWLVEAHRFCVRSPRPVIAHSECNVAFGREPVLWLHADSESPDFEPDYLRVGNYWDAMSFADRDIYLEVPFRKNDISAGYGHEDWHWNCETLLRGFPHRPVPGTIHAKRQREGSQSAICNATGVVPWPNALESYSWERAPARPPDRERQSPPRREAILSLVRQSRA
jgi:hypothetical protein